MYEIIVWDGEEMEAIDGPFEYRKACEAAEEIDHRSNGRLDVEIREAV